MEGAPEEESLEATSENRDGVHVTCWSRLFQVWVAATGKARLPTVDIRVRRTFSDSEEADRSRVGHGSLFSTRIRPDPQGLDPDPTRPGSIQTIQCHAVCDLWLNRGYKAV